jgi:hypothetical protein
VAAAFCRRCAADTRAILGLPLRRASGIFRALFLKAEAGIAAVWHCLSNAAAIQKQGNQNGSS